MAKNENKRDNLSPLKIFVIWHPDFTDGRKYADILFRTFSRDEVDFTGANIGIPVYYLTTPDFKYFESSVTNTEKTVFVLLINEKMVIDNDWRNFASLLFNFCDNNTKTIYPVAVNDIDSAKNICSNLAKINFIRLVVDHQSYDDKIFISSAKKLCFELAHELCRLLFNRERVTEETVTSSAQSIKVFLSHAKTDGERYASRINTYVSSKTSLKTFIDVNDIARGTNFEKAIENNIINSVLVAIYTDLYSSRDWCQKEVLSAKRKGCPIIILDALSDREIRRFPYGANTKVIHLGHEEISDDRCKEIVYEVLLEALKIKYNELFLKYSIILYKINEGNTKIFSYPPELYTLLINLEDSDEIVLYPEPPLNINELSILDKYKPNHLFITPTLLSCLDCYRNKFLTDKNIGLSISMPSTFGEIAQTDMHLAMFYTELCRYLLTADVNLLYAGNVNYKKDINFIDVLQELINNYCFNSEKNDRIKIFHLQNEIISDELKASMLPCFQFIQIEETPDDLTILRNKVAEKTFARIIVGGRTKGYPGKYPGIIEETYIALQKQTPIFILGAYGGASELIVKCMQGEEVKDSIDENLAATFKNAGLNNLGNGLSIEDNLELAYCNDIARSISLILKGLKKITQDNAKMINYDIK
jgi:hypothetical protein